MMALQVLLRKGKLLNINMASEEPTWWSTVEMRRGDHLRVPFDIITDYIPRDSFPPTETLPKTTNNKDSNMIFKNFDDVTAKNYLKEQLHKVFKKAITNKMYVHGYNGEHGKMPINETTPHLFLYCSPDPTPTIRDDGIIEPSGKGRAISIYIDSSDTEDSIPRTNIKENWPVFAEIIENAIYILHPFSKTYESILGFSIEKFKIAFKIISKNFTSPAVYDVEAVKNGCFIVLNRELKERKQSLLAGTQELNEQINQQQKLMNSLYWNLGQRKKELAELDDAGDQWTETQRDRKLSALRADPKIENIGIDPNTKKIFYVETTALYCTDPRTEILHEIGKFRIKINFNDYKIKWINLSCYINGFRNDMQAPHVFSEGNACMGSAGNNFLSMMQKGDLLGIVMYAIQFIESVYIEDCAGKYIDKWPQK